MDKRRIDMADTTVYNAAQRTPFSATQLYNNLYNAAQAAGSTGTGTYTPTGGQDTFNSGLNTQMTGLAQQNLANPGLGYDPVYGQQMYANMQDSLASQYLGADKQLQDQYAGWGGRGAGIYNAAQAALMGSVNAAGAQNARQVYMDAQDRMTAAKQQAWANAMGLNQFQGDIFNNQQGRVVQNNQIAASSFNDAQARQQAAQAAQASQYNNLLPYAINSAATGTGGISPNQMEGYKYINGEKVAGYYLLDPQTGTPMTFTPLNQAAPKQQVIKKPASSSNITYDWATGQQITDQFGMPTAYGRNYLDSRTALNKGAVGGVTAYPSSYKPTTPQGNSTTGYSLAQLQALGYNPNT